MKKTDRPKKVDLSKRSSMEKSALANAKAEEKHEKHKESFILRCKNGTIIQCKTKERLEQYKKHLGL